MYWLVGAGPGDPALLTGRALQLLSTADCVIAEPALWPMVRELGSAVPLLPVTDARHWPPADGATVVRLYRGDALAGSADDRAALAATDAEFDVVAGLDADAAARIDAALGAAAARLRPLAGRSIVVTRPQPQQAALAGPLRRLGATVVSLPTIAIGPPADDGAALRRAVDRLDEIDWLVLTSANGARALLDVLPDARRLAGVRIAAIGPATAAVLAAAHLPADLVPGEFVAEALLAAFPAPPPAPGVGRVLLVRAAVARDTLPDGLRAAGWQVEVVAAYETRAAPAPPDLSLVAGADAVTFSSPSTVAHFVELVGPQRVAAGGGEDPMAVIAIGPVTAAAAATLGVRVDAVAERYDVAGLIDAVLRWNEAGGRA